MAPRFWGGLRERSGRSPHALLFGPRDLVVITGLPGSGKSTLMRRTVRGPRVDSQDTRDRWDARMPGLLPYALYRPLVRRTLPLAIDLARGNRALGARLYDGLSRPFSTDMLEQLRRLVRLWVARELGEPRLCAEALASLEPHPPWDEQVLEFRYECYAAAGSPLAERAREALKAFRAAAPPVLTADLAK